MSPKKVQSPPEGFTESPTGSHYVGKDGEKVAKPTPGGFNFSGLLNTPITLPTFVILGLLGVGAKWGPNMLGIGSDSPQYVTKEEMDTRFAQHELEHQKMQQDIAKINSDMQDVSSDIKDLNELFDKAFPRFK